MEFIELNMKETGKRVSFRPDRISAVMESDAITPTKVFVQGDPLPFQVRQTADEVMKAIANQDTAKRADLEQQMRDDKASYEKAWRDMNNFIIDLFRENKQLKEHLSEGSDLIKDLVKQLGTQKAEMELLKVEVEALRSCRPVDTNETKEAE